MANYRHASIAPIIEEITNVLTHLGEDDSKAYLIKQYNKDDSFKGLAENIREWKIKYTDQKPPVKSKLADQLIALEEYFEERKCLDIYQGLKTKKPTYFCLEDFLKGLSALCDM
jgi:hypothetical protein